VRARGDGRTSVTGDIFGLKNVEVPCDNGGYEDNQKEIWLVNNQKDDMVGRYLGGGYGWSIIGRRIRWVDNWKEDMLYTRCIPFVIHFCFLHS
jgi:hypothetical protein